MLSTSENANNRGRDSARSKNQPSGDSRGTETFVVTCAPELTEGEAVRLAQGGDPDAFERLYRMHSRRVYALCLRVCGSELEAQDLTQDVFLQVFRRIQSFRGESKFSTWLFRIAMNVVLMRLRKKRHPEVSLDASSGGDEEDVPKMQIGTPDLQLQGTIDRLLIERAICQLPRGYRQAFLLHDVEGYEHQEIAQIFRCSVGNSKSQLHKARMRMRELLATNSPPATQGSERIHREQDIRAMGSVPERALWQRMAVENNFPVTQGT